MARLIQITCPGCHTTLKVNCGAQDMVEVNCPKCSKRLAARVPTPAASVPVAAPAPEIDPAFWNAPPPTPVSPPSRPAYATPPRPVTRPPARQVMRSSQSQRGSRGGLKIALAAVAMLLLLPVGWGVFVAVRALSRGGLDELASISILPDSHEKVVADFFAVQERQMREFLDAEKIDQAYVDDLRASATARQRTAERLLLRAVKLDAASREQQVAFTRQSKELMDRYKERSEERALSLTAEEQQLIKGAYDIAKNKDAMLFAMAVSAFMTRGQFQLPEPDGAREQVHFDEAEVVREYLRVLANVNSTRGLSAAAEKIEALADRVADVAVQRAGMPSGLDFVDTEYEVADRAFDLTEDALLRRIERDFDSNRSFENAQANFESAREMVSRAAMGASEATIRTAFAEARAARTRPASEQVSVGSQPTGSSKSASDAAASVPAARVAARPPAENNRGDQESSSAASAPKFNQPPKFSVAPSSPAAASSSSADTPARSETSPASAPAGNDPPQQSPAGTEVASGAPFGPRGGFGPSGRFGPVNPFGPTPYAPSGRMGPGDADGSLPGRNPAGPRFGPGPGYPGFGPMGPSGPYGNGSRQNGFEELLKRFDGPTGVKIFVNTPDNASRFGKSITSKLGVREHAFQSYGGKTTIAIRYSGSLEKVEQAIDFGTVTGTDKAKREIHVDATK